MEEFSSASESSTGHSTSDTEKDIDRADLMLYFASSYGKLYRHINNLRNQHAQFKKDCSNCEGGVHKRLDELEKNISQNVQDIQLVLYRVTELSKSIESIQKIISQLNIAVDDQDQADILSKNTSARPSL